METTNTIKTAKKLLLCCFCMLAMQVSVRAQPKLNMTLKKELDSMYVLDQRYRQMMGDLSTKSDSLSKVLHLPKAELLNHILKMQTMIDSSNAVRMEKIFAEFGYPGKTMVGSPSNEVGFYVIQHSDRIDAYIGHIRTAAENGELSFHLYAMMLDRSLMYKGQEQVYGTQGRAMELPDAQTGKKQMKMIIWPIKDPATVNERRKKAGFAQTVEENAKRLGIDYKVITLEEIERMKRQ